MVFTGFNRLLFFIESLLRKGGKFTKRNVIFTLLTSPWNLTKPLIITRTFSHNGFKITSRKSA